ncbi:hypothetical protein LINPERHAP2_LOCUS32311, partial [Linum perenne]
KQGSSSSSSLDSWFQTRRLFDFHTLFLLHELHRYDPITLLPTRCFSAFSILSAWSLEDNRRFRRRRMKCSI